VGKKGCELKALGNVVKGQRYSMGDKYSSVMGIHLLFLLCADLRVYH